MRRRRIRRNAIDACRVMPSYGITAHCMQKEAVNLEGCQKGCAWSSEEEPKGCAWSSEVEPKGCAWSSEEEPKGCAWSSEEEPKGCA